tara:strand:+ start:235 stop:537 length:303 start_codon:yes stop_codon:yes gene_type:complete
MSQSIEEIIFSAVNEINDQLPVEKRMVLSLDCGLFGKTGNLDSLELVNFIVIAEQKIEEGLGVSIVLADERAMSQAKSPFRTLGTLVEYIACLIKESSKI